MARTPVVILWSSLLAFSGAVGAAGDEQPRLVDQTIGDVDPLGTSLRVVDFEVDLRQDIDFRYVYTVPGQPGRLMRRQGGLVAIFDRSEYLPTWFGPLAVVPANTVFHIGGPPEPARAEIFAPGRLDPRVQGLVPATAAALRADEATAVRPAISGDRGDFHRADLADEPYRRQRLREITDRAIARLGG